MEQLNLFATPSAPAWRPDPDKVRARLTRILNEARAAEVMPWEPAQLSLYRTIVPDMTRWLPEDEGRRWLADFEGELARLGVETESEGPEASYHERRAG